MHFEFSRELHVFYGNRHFYISTHYLVECKHDLFLQHEIL